VSRLTTFKQSLSIASRSLSPPSKCIGLALAMRCCPGTRHTRGKLRISYSVRRAIAHKQTQTKCKGSSTVKIGTTLAAQKHAPLARPHRRCYAKNVNGTILCRRNYGHELSNEGRDGGAFHPRKILLDAGYFLRVPQRQPSQGGPFTMFRLELSGMQNSVE
jgi:hypothetical protein